MNEAIRFGLYLSNNLYEERWQILITMVKHGYMEGYEECHRREDGNDIQ